MSIDQDGDQLRALEEAHRQPTSFRQVPDSKPLVYGYVRNSCQRPTVVERNAELLRTWCNDEGWHLGAVFRDIAVSSKALIRPGFTGLRDVLWLPDSYAVVVVDLVHLSRRVSVIQTLTRQIRATGARLLVLNDNLLALDEQGDQPADEYSNRAAYRSPKGTSHE